MCLLALGRRKVNHDEAPSEGAKRSAFGLCVHRHRVVGRAVCGLCGQHGNMRPHQLQHDPAMLAPTEDSWHFMHLQAS